MNSGSSNFIGQDAAWKEWESALSSSRMHHAWLLAGAQGLGKRVFARAAAAELVRQDGKPGPAPDRHPDIHILSHLPKNDAEAKKKADGKPYEKKRNITVDQIRAMQQRLTTRPTLGERRAIIIDPADDLEKGAVNALLKSLEEPPVGTYFLLVAHQPGRLLPTVRSRCRKLRFAALSNKDIDAVLRREMPEANSDLRDAAIAAAQGSPGVALAFIEHDLGKLHDLMQRIMQEGDADFTLRGGLADAMGSRPQRDRLLAALDLSRTALAAQIGNGTRDRQLRMIEAHGALSKLTTQAPTYNFDPGLLIMEIGGLLASTAIPRETA